MAIKNSKEQRETASRAAVFSTHRCPRPKDFRGSWDVARCKFSGRTAKTANTAVSPPRATQG
jgi:hypothetical protein